MKNRSRVFVITSVLLIAAAAWIPGLRSRRVAAQGPSLTGTYGYLGTVAYTATNPNPLAVLGTITFDGAGNAKGNQTVVAQDPTPNATTVLSQTSEYTGTYVLNPDGSGTLTLQFGTPTPIAFVLTDGGAGFQFVQTGGGNQLLTGSGRKQ